MKTVLVVHPQFDMIGGAEVVSARIMEWLADRLDAKIALLTLTPTKRNALVRAGMSESTADRIEFEVARCPRFISASTKRFHILQLAFLHRRARQICSDYDVCISTYNELDFGRSGVQYVHHPSFASRSFLRKHNMLGRLSILDTVPFAGSVYRKLALMISGEHPTGYQKNITLVNSSFMSDVLEKAHQIESIVVYPAFLTEEWIKESVAWENRGLRFVSVGRISPDKNFSLLIDHYAMLHEEFPGANFVIIGRSLDAEYEGTLIRQAEARGVPLKLLKNQSPGELRSILSKSKFYVHPKIDEHFGISIVEAAASGCLTMVHHSGAAEEIVKAPQLLFRDGRDLVSKVKCLLDDNAMRSNVIETIQSNLTNFTLEKFNLRLDNVLLPKLKAAIREE